MNSKTNLRWIVVSLTLACAVGYVMYVSPVHAIPSCPEPPCSPRLEPTDVPIPTPTAPPARPDGLAIVGVETTWLTLRWRDNSTNESYFSLERRLAGESQWREVARAQRNPEQQRSMGQWVSVVDARLRSNTRYCYRVAAANSRGKAYAPDEACGITDRGELQARLRLLTHNVWGVDDRQCDLRASEFGRLVAIANPAYDIVGVQEYYNTFDADLATCDASHLSDAIWSTGRYRNSDNYNRFNPNGEPWQLEADGGIGIFTLHPIEKFDEWEWDQYKGPLRPVEGFIFARLRIPGTSLKVDTYIVHLWSGSDHRSERKEQLQKLASKIRELSRDSGNPVLVMGDFNIGGPPTRNGNTGYDDIMQILGHPRDLWMEAHPDDPGYTYDCLENTVVDCSYRERIDYIFALTDPRFTTSRHDIVIANPNDARVVEWRVITPPYGHHVSDHFGVEATLEIRR